MKKEQFLWDLRIRLSGLPYADQKKSLEYYSEIIDDQIEQGLSEEEAIRRIGTPATVAMHIMQDAAIAPPTRIKQPKGERSGAITALIILGSPIWISLLVAFCAVAISVLAVFVSLLAVFVALAISLWAIEASLAASSVGCLLACPLVLLYGEFAFSVFMLGNAFLLAALTIFFFYGAIYGSKWLLRLCGYILKLCGLFVRFIKFIINRREEIQ